MGYVIIYLILVLMEVVRIIEFLYFRSCKWIEFLSLRFYLGLIWGWDDFLEGLKVKVREYYNFVN